MMTDRRLMELEQSYLRRLTDLDLEQARLIIELLLSCVDDMESYQFTKGTQQVKAKAKFDDILMEARNFLNASKAKERSDG